MKKIIIIMCTALFLLSCDDMKTIRPSGKTTSEEHPVKLFNKILVSKGINVVVSNHAEQKVIVETQQNLHEYVDVFVTNECLIISLKPNISLGGKSRITVYATAEVVDHIVASEGSKVEIPNGISFTTLRLKAESGSEIKGFLKGKRIEVDLLGGSKAKLDIDCEHGLIATSYGGSKFDFSGKATYMDLHISDGGKMDGFGLSVVRLSANLIEGSQATITIDPTVSDEFASAKIEGYLNNGSKLIYRGNSAQVYVHTGERSLCINEANL